MVSRSSAFLPAAAPLLMATPQVPLTVVGTHRRSPWEGSSNNEDQSPVGLEKTVVVVRHE